MAEDYITLPIETDPDALAQEAFDYLETEVPGFSAAEGNVETRLIEAMARIAAEVRDVASDVPLAIFRYWGAEIIGLAPIDDVAATTTATVTVVDNAGYTIPEGFTVSLRADDGTDYAFEVSEDTTVDPGDTTAVVTLIAVEGTEDANGLSGTADLVDATTFIVSVVTIADTSGGTTAETDEEYVDRLTAELQLLTPRPILPEDFAVLARRVDGVERAVAVDGYNPNHNMLTAEQASLEGGTTTGWAATTNCAIANSAAHAADGTKSLELSSSAGGDMVASTPTGLSGEVVEPYQNYTARAQVKAATDARTCSIGIGWYDSGGSIIGSIEYGTGVADTTANFDTVITATFDAPATAAFAAVFVKVAATGGASEEHYFDKIRFAFGTSTVFQSGGTDPDDNERTISVALIDDAGDAVSSGVKTSVEDLLESYREVNFNVFTIDADYTTINVAFTAVAHEDYDASTVETDAEAAIADYLDPANWGLPPEGTGQEREWRNVPIVRYLEVATVLNNVDGLDTITTLTINSGTADITMPGKAPLPQIGTNVGTVSAP